jgi:protein phosphatase
MIEFEITSASRVGCVRRQNEDMILVDSHFVRNSDYATTATLKSEDRYIIAIADGMGGHNRGDVASNDVLKNLQFYYHDLPMGLGASEYYEAVVEWLDSINNFIASKGRADEQYQGMGTTLVALSYYCGDFYTVNCGDSRLYRFRDSQLTQLTTDHSLNELLGEEKHTNIITNCIGGGCTSSYADMVQITNDVKTGDLYMLCSDGLTDMVPVDKITELLAGGADANALCEAAIAAGGFDNVSTCIIKVK